MITYGLPCLTCGELKEVVYDDVSQCWNATSFTSHGNYGSGVFDPLAGEELRLVVCDFCMRNYADRMRLYRKLYQPVTYESESWTPPTAN